MSFHREVLSAPQQCTLWEVSAALSERGYYLGGGTAIATHLGHRLSVDLDWFTGEPLDDPPGLAEVLSREAPAFQTTSQDAGTLHGELNGVRLTFLSYRYPLLRPLAHWKEFGANVADLDDLAAMKLSAVAQRGAKRDFVDLYALCRDHRPLRELLDIYREKFNVSDTAHVLYGLSYFEDAERERMPKMVIGVDWKAIKRSFRRWVTEIAR